MPTGSRDTLSESTSQPSSWRYKSSSSKRLGWRRRTIHPRLQLRLMTEAHEQCFGDEINVNKPLLSRRVLTQYTEGHRANERVRTRRLCIRKVTRDRVCLLQCSLWRALKGDPGQVRSTETPRQKSQSRARVRAEMQLGELHPPPSHAAMHTTASSLESSTKR